MDTFPVNFSILPDIVLEVNKHLPQLERDLHLLVQTPDSAPLLASAFRHMHTIKGDFSFCHATPIIELVHRLENVLQSLRDRHFKCSALVAEALVQSMEQVQFMMVTLEEKEEYDNIPRDHLLQLIEKLAAARMQSVADHLARQILLAAHNPWDSITEDSWEPIPPAPAASVARAKAVGLPLAQALAERLPPWEKRVTFQQALVLQLNQEYDHPSNVEALELAVIWHDVGLLACTDSLLQALCHPHPNLTPKSAVWPAYMAHVENSAHWLLQVAPECTEAAQIIRQHHTHANGTGIVRPEAPPPLHQGAQMLACADLMFERVGGLQGEEYRRGVLRTLFDVNGGLDTRFDAVLINAFEAVARSFKAP